MIWAHATFKDPCPICGKFDWCTFGDKRMLCQRVQSNRPAAHGGWYHEYHGKSNLQVTIPKAKPAPTHIDAKAKIESWKTRGELELQSFAQDLGVSIESLQALDATWSQVHQAWSFPMSDANGDYIGIRLRWDNGEKKAVTGSRQGIFLPILNADTPEQFYPNGIAFLPEGPTDTAALLTIGLYAIGRPTCMSGNDLIAQALKRLGIRKVVIVADNDEIKIDGKRPGIVGAQKLKKELGLQSIIWLPPAPIKDVREFLKAGGTKEMIMNEIKNKVWSKL